MKKTAIFGISQEELTKKSICVAKDKDSNIIELVINNYSDFDWLISAVNVPSAKYDANWKRYYRGVSSSAYPLESGIERFKLEEYEARLINSMYSNAPNDFSKCRNDFEMIALMQHYGLPTRLLDFTRSPLIALWFACQQTTNDQCQDGAVYVAVSSCQMSQRLIDIICKFVKHERDDIDKDGVLAYQSRSDLEYYSNQIYGSNCGLFFVNTPLIDKREENQQSVFLVATNMLRCITIKHKDIIRTPFSIGNYLDYIPLIQKSTGDPSIDGRIISHEIKCFHKEFSDMMLKIVIPAKEKESILIKLAQLGISKTFIFPTLENIAKEIKQDILDDKNVYENLRIQMTKK